MAATARTGAHNASTLSSSSSVSTAATATAAATEQVLEVLRREFPTLDDAIVESVACAVGIGRYTLPNARKCLREMVVLEDVYGAVEDAERRKGDEGGKAVAAAAAPGSAVAGGGGGSSSNVSLPSTPLVGLRDGEVVLYTTAITASRQVRDRCRQVRNALFILRVTFHEMDVSENVFMRKKLVQLCDNEDLGLPLLFVGQQPVGGFTAVDDLIENHSLLPRLQGLGYVHDPAAFDARLVSIYDEDDGDDEDNSGMPHCRSGSERTASEGSDDDDDDDDTE